MAIGVRAGTQGGLGDTGGSRGGWVGGEGTGAK